MLRSVFQAFDRRLDPHSRAPLAVAVSGGGDSLALLVLAKAWADRSGRSLLALSVDHGLQRQSAAWTHTAGEAARRVGAAFRALRWDGDKPVRGLPAAARAARHGLIAEAAREAGASVILVGHTFDDQLENALMRAAGEPVGVLREWSPSPVWPQGRGLFHLRPLLTARRADLRAWLSEQGLSWIEDPANDDPRSPRARARARLRGGAEPDLADRGKDDGALRALAMTCSVADWGGIVAPLAGLQSHAEGALRLLQIAAACASGGSALPRPDRARTILERLISGRRFISTLGGARFDVGRNLFVTREAGEFRRSGAEPVRLPEGYPTVWDGRFELIAHRPGLTANALRGHAAALPDEEKSRLYALPASARGALPAIMSAGSAPTCPLLAGAGARGGDVTALGLVEPRFGAACGLIQSEGENTVIGEVANRAQSSYVGLEAKGVFE